jgi:hypothetical protein
MVDCVTSTPNGSGVLDIVDVEMAIDEIPRGFLDCEIEADKLRRITHTVINR